MLHEARDELLTHQLISGLEGQAEGETEREKKKKGGTGLGEREMGKELRLLTDGCERGAEVLLSTVRVQTVCECVCASLCAPLSICVHVPCA